MKVLVTGGCGFLGTHVCEHFIKKGWEVVAYDNLTKYELIRTGYNVEAIRTYNSSFLKGLGVNVQVKDIRDRGELFLSIQGVDYIIHTAAQPAMTIAIENPVLDFENNVLGTLNVLEAARLNEIPIVNCSTIHIYGNGINDFLIEEPTRFTRIPRTVQEDDSILTGTLSPLHASKRAAEVYVQAYIDTYGLKAATFRLTGMYGPKQFGGEDHGWVANFAIRTVMDLPIKVYGTDKQVRDILYVTDVAQAFDKWFHHSCPSGLYNIGGESRTAISIRECIDLIGKIAGKTHIETLEPARKGDLYWFISYCGKAWKSFGWAPRVMPIEGLKLLVDWIEKERWLFQP